MNLIGKVAVLGTGLLGASLARALKKHGLVKEISAWSRSQQTRLKCVELKNVFDFVYDKPANAVKDADLIVLCAPTANIPPLAQEIAPFIKAGAIVTDVGSVKSAICQKCAQIFNGTKIDFIGSHPMAGSEKIGIDFSDETLFERRPCFIVPSSFSTQNNVELLEKMWSLIGMRTYKVSACQHDAIVAHVSHLPHLLAGTLCVNASKFKDDLKLFSGPGFRDTTRVASGSPAVWDSIIADNRDEILNALKSYEKDLHTLIAQIESSDSEAIAKHLRAAKKYRDELQNTL